MQTFEAELARFVPQQDVERLRRAYGGTVAVGQRPFLLLVDFTYAFTGRNDLSAEDNLARYPLSCGDDAWAAVRVASELLERARSSGIPVVFTKNEPRDQVEGSDSWSERLGDARMRVEPDADDIVTELQPRRGELVITKNKPSGFFETRLVSWVIANRRDSVVVAGGSTSGCVRATVTDAFSNNLKVVVPFRSTFDRLDASRIVGLFDMNTKYARVVDTPDAIEILSTEQSVQ